MSYLDVMPHYVVLKANAPVTMVRGGIKKNGDEITFTNITTTIRPFMRD